MGGSAGKDFLIQKDNGAGGFETVGGQRTATLTVNNEQIDLTNKTGATRWRQLITGGVQTMSLSGAGIFDDTTRLKALRTDALANTVDAYRIIDAYGDYFQGDFQITSWEESGENTTELTCTFSLENAGDITFTEV